jgi:polyhydroxybutyrate depolymerase
VVLGCLLSERIVAIGSVSGAYTFPLEECKPARPVPMIAFHGTADPVVPYDGGPSRDFNIPFPYIPDWMQERAVLNGCDPGPVELPAQGDASGYRYSNCDDNAEVIFYSVAGSGHGWPGGESIPEWIVGPTSQDIDATRVIWEFFKQHRLAK